MPRREYTAADFPPPGTILTFPLADGRFGACRVLRIDTQFGSDYLYALVALTEHISSLLPDLNDPALRRFLLLNHHHWANAKRIMQSARGIEPCQGLGS